MVFKEKNKIQINVFYKIRIDCADKYGIKFFKV